MKKIFLFVTMAQIFFASYSTGQVLKVEYSEKMNVSEQLKNIEDPAIRQIVMQKIGAAKTYELINQAGISIYQKAENKELELESNVQVIGGTGDIVYMNHGKNEFITQTNFLNRNFLIKDKIEKFNWKLTDETKKIGEYQCKKATATIDNNIRTAWYSEEIPSNAGPSVYGGLPGLILEIKAGNKIITATKISFIKEKIEIKPPTKGKIVTRDKFNKIKEEKIKALGGNSDKGVKIINIK